MNEDICMAAAIFDISKFYGSDGQTNSTNHNEDHSGFHSLSSGFHFIEFGV